MERYLSILQEEISDISENDIFTPIKQTHIDSIDLVVIRVALEKYFNFEIPDVIWYNFQSLEEALKYFHANKGSKFPNQIKSKVDVSLVDIKEIRMPQMANNSLSEFWLLKHLGDTHWQLLTKGFDKKSSEFKNDNNNRLYATFIRIKYEVSPLFTFYENEEISFKSNLKGYGNNTFLSKITGLCSEKRIQAVLMTTFSERQGKDNTKISKCEPKVKSSKVVSLLKKPLFLNDYRLLRKNLIDKIASPFGDFNIEDSSFYSCDYTINPYHDINGVGLLYYASYPIISDSCLLKYNSNLIVYHTVYRDIFYFANTHSDDKIIFKLNSINENSLQIKIITTLYRESDNQLLARILTVKQKEE